MGKVKRVLLGAKERRNRAADLAARQNEKRPAHILRLQRQLREALADAETWKGLYRAMQHDREEYKRAAEYSRALAERTLDAWEEEIGISGHREPQSFRGQ